MALQTPNCTIISNRQIAVDIYELTAAVPQEITAKPGQFVNVAVPHKYLRRPLGICDLSGGKLTLIYRVIGGGTQNLSGIKAGETINIMLPLGNGFDLKSSENKRTVIVGGGLGIVPLYLLAKALKDRRDVTVVLGFNRKEDAICIEQFREICADVRVVTVDGSLGEKGFPTTAALKLNPEYYYTCGPQVMMDAMHASGLPGQLSFEARMGCGFGACMGCTMVTKNGPKRVCAEGPVFSSDIILREGV